MAPVTIINCSFDLDMYGLRTRFVVMDLVGLATFHDHAGRQTGREHGKRCADTAD